MEMLLSIKKGVFNTQQRLFMAISVLKIKGKLIACKIIYLLHCFCHKMHCFREGSNQKQELPVVAMFGNGL
jgi:hypothetical protein